MSTHFPEACHGKLRAYYFWHEPTDTVQPLGNAMFEVFGRICACGLNRGASGGVLGVKEATRGYCLLPTRHHELPT